MFKSNQSTQKPESNVHVSKRQHTGNVKKKGCNLSLSTPLSEKIITQSLSTKQPSIYDSSKKLCGGEEGKTKFLTFSTSSLFLSCKCSFYCAFESKKFYFPDCSFTI